jgi:hypothetical protein
MLVGAFFAFCNHEALPCFCLSDQRPRKMVANPCDRNKKRFFCLLFFAPQRKGSRLPGRNPAVLVNQSVTARP